jgi:DNA-binding XRE family transcriptional regulator
MKATPNDARPYLARTVSRLRRQSGLTRNELALLADLSRQAISLIEEGRRADLSWGTIQQLALALGVPTDVFRNPELGAHAMGGASGGGAKHRCRGCASATCFVTAMGKASDAKSHLRAAGVGARPW